MKIMESVLFGVPEELFGSGPNRSVPRKGVTMPVWMPLGIVLLGGAVGGIINAIISDNGFVVPREETINNVCIVRPGIAGNVLVGAVAAFISWGLYGSYSGALIFSSSGSLGMSELNLTLSSVAGAILIGMGGARWLTNEVDKSLLKTAAVTAAVSRPSSEDSQRMVVATPSQTFNIAKGMYMNR
jgi:hypothetical protein